MNVLVDTSVWSLLLRHKPTTDNALQIQKLKTIVTELIHTQQIRLMGSIRQELLSGVVHQAQFDKLVVAVSAFEDEVITYNDYICAAQSFNQCRAQGIQGSHVDFLICAVAMNHHLRILTTDKDFIHYQKILPLDVWMPNFLDS